MEVIFNNTKKHPTDDGPCNHELVVLEKGTHQMCNYTYTSCVICGVLLHHLTRNAQGKLFRKYDYTGYWEKMTYGYPNPLLVEYKKNIKSLKKLLFSIPLTKKEKEILIKKQHE